MSIPSHRQSPPFAIPRARGGLLPRYSCDRQIFATEGKATGHARKLARCIKAPVYVYVDYGDGQWLPLRIEGRQVSE